MKNCKSLFFIMLLLSLIFLMACINDSEDNKTNYILLEYDLIASEKVLPTNFNEIAFEREETPYFQYLVRKTTGQSEYEVEWDLFEFEENMAEVNFKENDVFFIGLHESGTCPYHIENLELSSDEKIMKVQLLEPEGDCTDDATPRSIVIQIAKEISKDIESLVIVQSNVETHISLDN